MTNQSVAMVTDASSKEATLRFLYIRDNKRPMTIAYKFDDEGQRIVYNISECSMKDTFSKVQGKLRAAGRLAVNRPKHPNLVIPYNDVSEEGKPRYRLITDKLFELHSDE